MNTMNTPVAVARYFGHMPQQLDRAAAQAAARIVALGHARRLRDEVRYYRRKLATVEVMFSVHMREWEDALDDARADWRDAIWEMNRRTM